MGIDGAGQKIAVVGQSAIDLSDIQTFRSLSGLPANDPQVTLVPGGSDPGMVPGDIDEANLDVEWAGAVARRATILYVYADPDDGGVLEALVHAIEEKLAPVISSVLQPIPAPQIVITVTASLTKAWPSICPQRYRT
jgi:subtilase family serine protease